MRKANKLTRTNLLLLVGTSSARLPSAEHASRSVRLTAKTSSVADVWKILLAFAPIAAIKLSDQVRILSSTRKCAGIAWLKGMQTASTKWMIISLMLGVKDIT